VCFIREFFLDDGAVCTPVSINFSREIFDRAQKIVLERNRANSSNWFILGTWHGHPPGYAQYSSTDEATLFRERMRLRTDDPSLAGSPYVHFIIPNYGLDLPGMRVFTMRIRPNYELKEMRRPEEASVIEDDLINLACSDSNLGILARSRNDHILHLEQYHPRGFTKHERNEISTAGIWKYFPFPQIPYEFEKVFLENFYQKTQMHKFTYIRILRLTDATRPLIRWFECSRPSAPTELSEVITFVEIAIELTREQPCY
jgi:hypothetical protein